MSMKIRGFGHLFGLGANASEDDEGEKEKSKNAKDRRAEEDGNDDQDDKDKSKKSKRAEDEGDDSDDQDDKDKEKSKKAKGRRAEDDDDDADADEDEGDENDGDDDEDDRDVKKGRRAERNRISRILGSKYAAGKGPLAVSLAITTGMSSAAAIRVMASSGPAPVASQNRRISLDERMAKVENHQLGNSDAGGPAANSVVSRAAALYNQVKGKK
ncbi:Prophage protein [Serratia proteamaculans]|uniref:DNA primase n=1 Tax=Serratia proteamaculans TaxID=28151 RepID=UPI0009F7BEAB|nr:DNA primase [Serratia proteamaculans]SMB46792.1 Prophage protein [Serratia proteamaculans]